MDKYHVACVYLNTHFGLVPRSSTIIRHVIIKIIIRSRVESRICLSMTNNWRVESLQQNRNKKSTSAFTLGVTPLALECNAAPGPKELQYNRKFYHLRRWRGQGRLIHSASSLWQRHSRLLFLTAVLIRHSACHLHGGSYKDSFRCLNVSQCSTTREGGGRLLRSCKKKNRTEEGQNIRHVGGSILFLHQQATLFPHCFHASQGRDDGNNAGEWMNQSGEIVL